MPYSLACGTPLSNFEAGSNYKDKSDPYILVSFPKVGEEDVELVVMTTTPWTLPSNLALCVNPDYDYVKILDKETGKKYVLLKNRLEEIYSKPEVPLPSPPSLSPLPSLLPFSILFLFFLTPPPRKENNTKPLKLSRERP